MDKETQQEDDYSHREEVHNISKQANINNVNLNKSGSKGKTIPRLEIESNSSYAKPTLSSKFKSVKKTVNRLAKYRATQEVLGFKRNSTSKNYRFSIDPSLLQSFQALSKASLSNAEAIYQEAKKDLLLNTSLPVAKIIQIQSKGMNKDVRQREKEPTQKTASTIETDHTKLKQNTVKNNPNTTEQWTTNIPSYTLGSSKHISLPDTQKTKFKHSTPPSQTSQEEDVEMELTPPKVVEETIDEVLIEEDSLPDLTTTKNPSKKRVLRSNSRHLE